MADTNDINGVAAFRTANVRSVATPFLLKQKYEYYECQLTRVK